MIIKLNLPQQYVMALSAALVLLVAFTLFYTLWQWRSDWILAHQSAASIPVAVKADESVDRIAALPSEHLFGKAAGGEVPITSLQLRVTGIVKIHTSDTGTQSKAYISISGQPSKIYQVGDSLPYGVKVYDILPNAVILENDGRLEKLPLPREKLTFKPKNIEESS
jgi:general secretion pathway protein C